MAGIIGYGVYIPRYRIEQKETQIPWSNWAGGEKAVCGADEDVVTMAVEATENAIKHAGIDPTQIDAIYLGTASSPYIEGHLLSPIFAEIWALPPEVRVQDYSGSLNALATALLGCLDAIQAKSIKCGLVIGTENRLTAPGTESDASLGAGAVSMVIGTEDTIADFEAVHTYSTLFIDRWEAAEDGWVSNYFDYRFDREYGYKKHITEASKGLIQKVGHKGQDFTHVVFQQPDDRSPNLPTKELGIKAEQLAPPIASTLGDLGSCSAFISLAGVLDKAESGEKILLATYGSGSSNAMSITVNKAIDKNRKRIFPLEKYAAKKEYITYVTYLKLREMIKRAPY